MPQICFINKPKKILQVWLFGAQNRGKKQKYIQLGENSRESLFKGESSKDNKRGSKALQDVPKGYLAVYVGAELQRYVIPMSYLSMPDFRVLMDSVAEEFGFEQEGGLQIPCEEEDFQKILLRCMAIHRRMSKIKNKKEN
ncbi:indole-3-acetic acid-induced protein ARG7-like [Pistacia vera]|uniref:indole-3-acetic acid-induced protein ARG7-like n=1 Tax=Pistacia vera TaxID=55513 RepID=UPI001263BAF9|nr:indole-3-acetic acid-induced protein ARG7-like [Pistacia vera]